MLKYLSAFALLLVASPANGAQDNCNWGAWSACTVTCGGGTQVRASVTCGSETAQCNTQACYCVDFPNWKSKTGTTCAQYKKNNLCYPNATYGPGWGKNWGTFADYKDTTFNLDPTEACCCCGREQVLCKKNGVQCLNGGTCHSGVCFCVNGYGGDYCELDPCQMEEQALREKGLKYWTSADEPLCDIQKAVDFLSDYGCVKEDGCQIVTCDQPVPQEKFTKLANCEISI